MINTKRNRWLIISCLVFLISLTLLAAHARAGFNTMNAEAEKPYRVLVIIGDQWKDPGSYNIDENRVAGDEFRDVITMLKIWGIPFDILRLDQQNLNINRFLDGIAEPGYGCLVWMADPDMLEGPHADYGTLQRAVREYGMSLIALFDFVKNQSICDLIGIDYDDYGITSMWYPENRFNIIRDHFITGGMEGISLPENVNVLTDTMAKHDYAASGAIYCKAKDDAQVLATLGNSPQVVVQNLSPETKTVWIGGERDWFKRYPVTRQIFRNALVWSLGYGLFNDRFEDSFTIVMDDMGASEHAYSMSWHYPTPGKELIIEHLVEPLEKYNAIMVQHVTPGYVNPESRMVESPWQIERFNDAFGQVQDYPSTKKGLDEGLRRGVFEIQVHRAWTHMNPDLESEPGPWWDASLKGEMSNVYWWDETYDTRRGKPVPSNDMLFVYRTGRDAIEKQFGVIPLDVTVRPADDLYHDNGRLAAIAGYGISRGRSYIGIDYVIQFSIMAPEVFVCHDLDLVKEPELPARWIEAKKDRRWMGFNEMCAYIHCKISGNGTEIQLDYDDHYCRYFSDHASAWTLELSAEFLEKMKSNEASISIDGNVTKHPLSLKQAIEITPGTGKHSIVFIKK